jgi:hypothetical protein
VLLTFVTELHLPQHLRPKLATSPLHTTRCPRVPIYSMHQRSTQQLPVTCGMKYLRKSRSQVPDQSQFSRGKRRILQGPHACSTTSKSISPSRRHRSKNSRARSRHLPQRSRSLHPIHGVDSPQRMLGTMTLLLTNMFKVSRNQHSGAISKSFTMKPLANIVLKQARRRLQHDRLQRIAKHTRPQT